MARVSNTVASNPVATGTVASLFERREQPVRDLAAQADEVAAACHAMAMRFHQGGKLVVFGIGGASTDAQHVAVEFVHPVIVGKRALPAISLTSDVATVTGIAASGGHGRDLLPPAPLPGRARRHRARHLGRRQLPERAGRPARRPRARAC